MAIFGGFEPLSGANDPNTYSGLYSKQVKDYIWRDNGKGGVNYFRRLDNGTTSFMQPITREVFAQGSGQDVGAIENFIRQNYKTTAPQTTTQPAQTQSAPQPVTSTTPEFIPRDYMGVTYNTPEELSAAIQANINKTYTENIRIINDNYNQGLLSLDDRDAQIKIMRTNLSDQLKNQMSNIQGYFNRIGADSVQSEQKTYEDRARTNYSNANALIGQEFDPSLYGADGKLRRDLSETELNPYANQVNTNTGAVARSYLGFKNQLSSQTAKAEEQKLEGLDSTVNSLRDFQNNVQTTLVNPTMATKNMGGMSGTVNNQSASVGGVELDYFGRPVKKDQSTWWS